MFKPPIYIVDIDGTVATHFGKNGEQRRGHYEYEKVSKDLPVPQIVQIVRALIGTSSFGHPKILYVSGRKESCREATAIWLAKYQIAQIGVSRNWLFLRPNDDNREDTIIKEEIYHRDIEPFYEVVACFEDRQQVVDMWRSLGLTCLQVAPGNF